MRRSFRGLIACNAGQGCSDRLAIACASPMSRAQIEGSVWKTDHAHAMRSRWEVHATCAAKDTTEMVAIHGVWPWRRAMVGADAPGMVSASVMPDGWGRRANHVQRSGTGTRATSDATERRARCMADAWQMEAASAWKGLLVRSAISAMKDSTARDAMWNAPRG